MDPIQNRMNVDYRIASLRAEAAAERLAAYQRRQHLDEHAAHPTLAHRHAAPRVRGAVGRLLIGLGNAIAGGHGAGAGAGRTA